jgi:hypothetical protein
MIKIFVLHYSELVERKKNILLQFEKHNITNYEFIEKYDKNFLTIENESLFTQDLKKSEISLMLKHFFVYNTNGKLEGKDWLLRNFPIFP